MDHSIGESNRRERVQHSQDSFLIITDDGVVGGRGGVATGVASHYIRPEAGTGGVRKA